MKWTERRAQQMETLNRLRFAANRAGTSLVAGKIDAAGAVAQFMADTEKLLSDLAAAAPELPLGTDAQNSPDPAIPSSESH